MSELFAQGGPVLDAIFALSFLAWVLIAWKGQELRSASADGAEWARGVQHSLMAEGRSAAAARCRGRRTVMARLLLATLEARGLPGRRVVEERVRPVLRSEAADLRRHLGVIAVAGGLAPLLGLLGTVVGLTGSFEALGDGGAIDRERVARGISGALLTTQAGLVVALPIVLAHRWLASRAERCLQAAELWAKRVEGDVERVSGRER